MPVAFNFANKPEIVLYLLFDRNLLFFLAFFYRLHLIPNSKKKQYF